MLNDIKCISRTAIWSLLVHAALCFLKLISALAPKSSSVRAQAAL